MFRQLSNQWCFGILVSIPTRCTRNILVVDYALRDSLCLLSNSNLLTRM